MEQLLADLKDIHLPVVQGVSSASQFVLWPYALFTALCLAVGWLTWRRKTVWRRQVLAELKHIDSLNHHDPAAAWQNLATLLRRVAIHRSDAEPSPRQSVSVARFTGEAWLRRLDELFSCDSFSNGPGRSLVKFPYTGHSPATDKSKNEKPGTSSCHDNATASLTKVIAIVRSGVRAMPD